MKSLFRHKAHKWHLMSANWLVGLEPNSDQNKMLYTWLENGLWQSLTPEQDNTRQVAEMTKRWSPVTNRRYFRHHGCPCKCPRRWGTHSSLPLNWQTVSAIVLRVKTGLDVASSLSVEAENMRRSSVWSWFSVLWLSPWKDSHEATVDVIRCMKLSRMIIGRIINVKPAFKWVHPSDQPATSSTPCGCLYVLSV